MVTESGLLGNSTNSSGHAESSPVLHQNQQLQQLQQSPAVTSFTTQGPVPPPAPPQVQQAKLNSSVSVDSTGTSAASSISTAPSPLPSAPTPPSSSVLSSSSTSLPLVNGPSSGRGYSSGPVVESISLRAMAQHAVDQQGTPSHTISVPLSAVEPTSNQNLLYSENNNSGSVVSVSSGGGGGSGVISNNNINNNNNNPGVVGGGRVTAGQLGSAPSHASRPPAPTGEAHIPPLLGVAPLGPVALSKEQQVRGFI